jgi:hypothetical protein
MGAVVSLHLWGLFRHVRRLRPDSGRIAKR